MDRRNFHAIFFDQRLDAFSHAGSGIHLRFCRHLVADRLDERLPLQLDRLSEAAPYRNRKL